MNVIVEAAKKNRKEKYITPEDISDLIGNDEISIDIIRKDFLEIFGIRTGWGIEDPSLCAFVCYEGKPISGEESC